MSSRKIPHLHVDEELRESNDLVLLYDSRFHFMDSSDQSVTTNASLAVEQINLIGSPPLDYRPNTSTGTPNEQTRRLHLTHFFSQPSSPQQPY